MKLAYYLYFIVENVQAILSVKKYIYLHPSFSRSLVNSRASVYYFFDITAFFLR